MVAVENTRKIGKKNMIHNSATPEIEVDPETYEVRADGELLDLRAGRSAADGAAVFLVLTRQRPILCQVSEPQITPAQPCTSRLLAPCKISLPA